MIADRARKWAGEIIGLLASGRLAVVLLLLLVGLFLLGIFAPLAGVWQSSWLRGASLLLLVNLSLCMIRRVPAVMAASRIPGRPPGCAALWPARTVPSSVPGPDVVGAVLRKRGYRTVIGDGSVYGLRGRFAAIGHWIFHLGLLVLLVGGLLGATGGRAFRAAAVVGEGEAFDLHESDLVGSTEPVTDDLATLRFTLDGIDALTEDLQVRRFDARVSAPDGSSTTMGINRPYRVPPYQVLTQGFGYMPGWVIVDARGRMLRGAWLKMAPFPYGGEEIIRIGPRTSDVVVTFYPDHDLESGEDVSRTYDLRNPRFRAKVRLRGETVFDGLLAPGQRVSLDEGRSFLFLEDIRMYGIFDVVRDQGYGVIFAGFGITTLGLFVRYGRIRKEVLVEATSSGLRVSGKSELLDSLFREEMDGLIEEMAGSVPALRPQESKT